MKNIRPNLYALGFVLVALLMAFSNFAAWFVTIHNASYNCKQANLLKSNIRNAEIKSRDKALQDVNKPGTIIYNIYHNNPQEFAAQIRDTNKLIKEFAPTDCKGSFSK